MDLMTPMTAPDDRMRLIETDLLDYLPVLSEVDVVLTDPPYYWWNILHELDVDTRDTFWPVYADIHLWLPLVLKRTRVGLWMTTDQKYLPYYHAAGVPWQRWPLTPRDGRHPVLLYTGQPLRAAPARECDELYHYGYDTPVAWWDYLLSLCPCDEGIVFDPFCGTGSGLIAAYQRGFRAIGVEQDPEVFQRCTRRVTACLAAAPLVHSGPAGPRLES